MIRGHTGETALHGNIAPPFLPRRGHSTSMYSVHRQTWAECLWAPFVPMAVNGTKMFSVQARTQSTNKSQRSLLIYEGWTGLRNMAANILLRSFGFALNKGVRLAYFGQILLLAIWSTQRWPRISNQERTPFEISCLEMLPLKISSLASTSERSKLP